MMGQRPRSDSLFYYFRLEDQIPNDQSFAHESEIEEAVEALQEMRDTYSAIGRPSIGSGSSVAPFAGGLSVRNHQ
jgi:hypothetical protein